MRARTSAPHAGTRTPHHDPARRLIRRPRTVRLPPNTGAHRAVWSPSGAAAPLDHDDHGDSFMSQASPARSFGGCLHARDGRRRPLSRNHLRKRACADRRSTRSELVLSRRLEHRGGDARSEVGATVGRARAFCPWLLGTEGGGTRVKSSVRGRGRRGPQGVDVAASPARRLARRLLVEADLDGVDDAVEGKLGYPADASHDVLV